ncbi:hypothetical protein [Quisquiliibacterium transsilvanicum]|uniref:TubC N-terminal docking domain-containing protein n=1 Tax=Quisquiliibacterium transsilvanicum TaxID=1549638 RepID=A0A7W8MAB4_9BURK|nr:hypothetical protein [Quisquiliibacterium transsilvanicum]MBB5273926.1 hypothetical protein [Quisquiliibacterium transsilvanicum]
MGAPDLLDELRGAGLVLTLTAHGGLHVAPRRTLTDEHRAAIREARDALVQALQAESAAPAWPIPADLAALLDASERIGLYGAEDRPAVPAMLAVDPEGTRGLIEDMHSRIGRCPRCRHFRRPGLSAGYCTGRADLTLAYGLLRELPEDGGARCDHFAPTLA